MESNSHYTPLLQYYGSLKSILGRVLTVSQLALYTDDIISGINSPQTHDGQNPLYGTMRSPRIVIGSLEVWRIVR